jgi:hypothetical protein
MKPAPAFWLAVCAGLAVAVAYQLSSSFPLARTVTAAPPGAAILGLAERPALPRPPDDEAQGLIAARPLFSESRRPHAPSPVPAAEAAREPSQPSLPRELAGTFLTATDQAALLLVAGESPAWLRKGQLIGGWRIEAIEQDRVQLSKGDQQQVLQLREDIAVLKTTRPAAGRQPARDDATPREPAREPADQDEAEE